MGDFNGNNYEDKFIGDLVNFVAGDKFQTMFETFFLDHALIFTNEEEHKLQYYEVYQEFHKLFEQELEGFCEDLGLSQTEYVYASIRPCITYNYDIFRLLNVCLLLHAVCCCTNALTNILTHTHTYLH